MCHDGSFPQSDIADKYGNSRKGVDGNTEDLEGAFQTNLERTSSLNIAGNIW